jgi:hypothetical protein
MLMDFQVSVNLFPCMDLQSLSNFSCEYLQNPYGLLSSHLGRESALRALHISNLPLVKKITLNSKRVPP